ncbi:MAG TPA: (deoxy)nucleoside triphosphate pyrophosphohydrolase [Bacillota bacterium]|nr:(deoxy)nucleoside triphosphate pyrophosphohydrolase [Bacillota bacterium]
MKRIDVVGAVIYDENKRILCALRGPNRSMEGFWEFPGGKIEPGENPKQALIREIKEELDCLIQVEDQIADVIHPYPEIEVHLTTYKSRLVEGSPKALEHKELRWVPIDQLWELNWAPADISTVRNIMESQLVL